MFLLLALLLERLAPLLPRSWREAVRRQTANEIRPSTPARAADIERFGEALIHVAKTEDQLIAAISFASRTRATMLQLDRSHAFHAFRVRRMTRLAAAEAARTPPVAPESVQPRALELSG